jgi:neutral ceramidase
MRRLFWFLLLLVSWPTQSACAGTLRAGVGRAEITPAVGTPLGGYAERKGKPSTGDHDPIMAKALVLDDGATRLAILTTDLVGTNPEMASLVAEKAGFPRDHLLICASHTHSGPGAYGKGLFATIALGTFQQGVFDHLADGMASALKAALGSMQPAQLAIGEAQLPSFMRNRRKALLKDPALWLLRVDRADGKPLAAFVDLTAHGTVMGAENMEMSADWMAFTQAYLERELPGVTALYANGAEGDISPNIHREEANFEGAKAHGERGGKATLDLYRSLKPSPEVKLSVKSETLPLPVTLKAQFAGTGKETFIQLLTINDALLLAVPGEMITQLGLALKAHALKQGYAHPVIVGLANDHLGYLLTRAEMKLGGYEAEVSFYGDGFGEQLTLEMARMIGGDVADVQDAINVPPMREEKTAPAARNAGHDAN